MKSIVTLLKMVKSFVTKTIFHFLFLPVFLLACLASRFVRKRIDVGLGPDPLINNAYHKQALEANGYTAETFVYGVYKMFDRFDYRADLAYKGFPKKMRIYLVFLRALFRYRVLYIYFNGGPLGRRYFMSRAEPYLLKFAGVKTVVMPYGADVQDLSRSPNPHYKHAMSLDYPRYRLKRKKVEEQIDRWTRHADHVISGCDWVDYMYHWDTLMLGHFSIDTDRWRPSPPADVGTDRPLRLLHAPNHRNIKGSEHFVRAVEELQAEGEAIELIVLENVTNDEVRQAMAECDVVCDQLIIGWYAMFTLEAMAMGKPVICYLRPDLKELFIGAGLIELDELPIVEASLFTVKNTLRTLADMDRAELAAIGEKSRAFVEKHHSLEAVGAIFAEINRSIGVRPSMPSVIEQKTVSASGVATSGAPLAGD